MGCPKDRIIIYGASEVYMKSKGKNIKKWAIFHIILVSKPYHPYWYIHDDCPKNKTIIHMASGI